MSITSKPRRGVVLGAGGVLGLSFTVGALTAFEDAFDWRVEDADVIVGTSAGSIMAALLCSGYSVNTVLRHQFDGRTDGVIPLEWDYDTDGGGVLPPTPLPGLGSPKLLLSALLRPRALPLMAALSGLLPRGRGTLAPVGRMIDRAAEGVSWPERDCWIVAFDYDHGKRTVFGREGAPAATLGEAVMASCSIPGWYRPVSIKGSRYVDGGTCSTTSVDLLAGSGLDEVVVVAPMASIEMDRPRSAVQKFERQVRRTVTKRTLNEIERVEASGTKVTFMCPGPEDLEVIGANMMDHRRRKAVLATSLRTQRAALRHHGSFR